MTTREEELDEHFLRCDFKVEDPYDCMCKEAVIGEPLWASPTGENECEYYCASCAYEKLHQYDGVDWDKEAEEFEKKFRASQQDIPPEFRLSDEDFWKLI